ncbi:MAG TPA: PGPGW domain-containing protein [Alloacidobacterium sp.]|nr:PGPGW domain-containing protein [Alloacidobacterium sp.]
MKSAENGRWRVLLRQGAGYTCLAAGIAGCLLPILPGVPFLFVGLGLLAIDSPWAARLRDRLKDFVARRRSRGSSNDPKSEDSAI